MVIRIRYEDPKDQPWPFPKNQAEILEADYKEHKPGPLVFTAPIDESPKIKTIWPGTEPYPEDLKAVEDAAHAIKGSPEAQQISALLSSNPKLANAAMVLIEAMEEEQQAVIKLLQWVKDSKSYTGGLWECPEDYTIIDALKDFANKKMRGPELWMHSKNGLACYKVISYDMESRRCQLEGPNETRLKPVIGDRETPLYFPHWSSKD